MVLRINPFRSFSCMKMLRWSFAYSAMVSDNSHLNWSSWFTTQNRLVVGLDDLVLQCFLDFLFVCFFFYFWLHCFTLLLELDEEKPREEVELILPPFFRGLLSKYKDFLLSSELFFERSTFSSALSAILFQSKFEEKKTFAKVFSNSRAPSSSLVKNERGQGSLGTRSYISLNGDLRNKIA